MFATTKKFSRYAILPAALALILGGTMQPAPAKAAGLLEVVAIGAGMVVGAGVACALTAGMGPAMMMGPLALEGAGAGAAAAGPMAAEAAAVGGGGMMAAEGGFLGRMAQMGSHMAAHVAFNPYRAAAVGLGALAGGYVFGLPF